VTCGAQLWCLVMVFVDTGSAAFGRRKAGRTDRQIKTSKVEIAASVKVRNPGRMFCH
jgi:hypothetical protein